MLVFVTDSTLAGGEPVVLQRPTSCWAWASSTGAEVLDAIEKLEPFNEEVPAEGRHLRQLRKLPARPSITTEGHRTC